MNYLSRRGVEMTNESVSARPAKSPPPPPPPPIPFFFWVDGVAEKPEGAVATFPIADDVSTILITRSIYAPLTCATPPPLLARFCFRYNVCISELILMSPSEGKILKFELWPLGTYASPNL